MRLRKGVLKSFNSGAYTATVQLASSYKAYIEDVAVARNISTTEMTLGRKELYSLMSTMSKRRC